MKIRFAREGDYAEIARLHRGTIRHVNSKDYPADIIKVWSSRTKAEKFRSSADKYKRWVALDGAKIIGFCDHSLEDPELGGLYIHKDYIGAGVGSQLLKTAEASMKEMGFKKIEVKSSITAKDFYMKNGYKLIKKTLRIMDTVKVPIYILSKKII